MNYFRSKSEALDWFSQSKYGIFVHVLYPDGRNRSNKPKDINDFANNFDTEKFAETCEMAGAEYVMFTIGQNSGYYCAPNQTLDTICGSKPGERCSFRDLPMDLAFSLKKRGIKMFLYAPSQGPSAAGDDIAVKFGAKSNDILWNDYKVNEKVADNWAAVLKEWADRYGDNVVGWWFDGNFPDVGIDDEFAIKMDRAIRSGNEFALAAYNPGQQMIKRHRPVGEYTAGEMRDLKWAPDDKYVDGLLWHILTYMGNGWGDPNVRYSDEEVIEFVKKTSQVGGVVSFDLYWDYDGTIASKQLEQLIKLKKALRR